MSDLWPGLDLIYGLPNNKNRCLKCTLSEFSTAASPVPRGPLAHVLDGAGVGGGWELEYTLERIAFRRISQGTLATLT